MTVALLAKTACLAGDRSASTALLARTALLDELRTWPKPGLVSPRDSGSHRDMDAGTLERSAAAIHPFFATLAVAGETGASLDELRRIGLAAEAAMMAATGGINAHRGAIFAIGLLCAAAGRGGYGFDRPEQAAAAVADLWGGGIMAIPTSLTSHGGLAARRHNVGGARREAAEGFPTVCKVAMPALRSARRSHPGDPGAARVQCLFATLAVLDDTNLLHRGGPAGLDWARRTASGFLAAGGVATSGWRAEAERIHCVFVERNLSPGGSADLLAVTLFLDSLCPEQPG